MPETVAATAANLFLAHEQALEHAAATIDHFLTQEAGLTPAECFVVCLRAAAKFLAQYDKNEWKDMIKHASELLLQHATLYKMSIGKELGPRSLTGASRGGTAFQLRFLKRQLSLPVSMMSQ